MKILSFKGGGARGHGAVTILRRLDEDRGGLVDAADLLAGTSTGAIIAAGLATGLRPVDLDELYRRELPGIFNQTLGRKLSGGGILKAKYSYHGLYKALNNTFGRIILGDLDKRVFIGAVDLNGDEEMQTAKIKFFNNADGPSNDKHERVVDVVMASCMAPVFFPTYMGYADGGLAGLGNPALHATYHVRDRRYDWEETSELIVLSIGTGVYPHAINEDKDWGILQWKDHLTTPIMSGIDDTMSFGCSLDLGDRFHEIDPILPQSWPMDLKDTSDLTRFFNKVDIQPTSLWLSSVNW